MIMIIGHNRVKYSTESRGERARLWGDRERERERERETERERERERKRERERELLQIGDGVGNKFGHLRKYL
jgi:hypothetical protein